MEYISYQPMVGGVSRMVHILATKLGMPLSCITPAQYDAKGAEEWWWFILDGSGPRIAQRAKLKQRSTWKIAIDPHQNNGREMCR
jgi:hypothetical protein